jgi:tRNA pseudouridine38-40 synthase
MAGTRRIALLVAYDGTAFSGSQSQPRGRTVQDVLEAALTSFTGERQRIRFAGRTDSGVHALGQVATLDTHTEHAPERFVAALNTYLPDDAAVRAACEVSASFDPRRAARSRCYRYRIEDGRPRSPLTRLGAWQLRERLDVEAMDAAAQALPRTARDWSAFAGRLAPDRSPVRTLDACRVRRCAPHRLEVWVEAESFLPHQVRRMVGALTQVGAGRIPAEAFLRLLDGAPTSAGPSAPPQGLTLVAVRYPQGTVDWDGDEDVPPAR